MGFLDRFNLRNTSGDEVTLPTNVSMRIKDWFNDEVEESKDLEELVPFRITKNIKNFRYAYKNNDTINTTINNLIIVANSEWTIDCDDKNKYQKAFDHILTKIEEWKLDTFVDNIIKYCMVDGSLFINRYLDNGSYKFRILGNDDDRFKWFIIRDTNTDEIIGYKQKCRIKKIEGNWKSLTFDALESVDYEDKEYNFNPDEIIYIPYQVEDGEGVSAINSCLDLAYIENKLLSYLLNSCKNAGGLLCIEFGNQDIDAGGLDDDEIDTVVQSFKHDGDDNVIGHPYGIKPNSITSSLPNFDSPISLIQSKIRNNLLTPDSKFSGSSSNRSTAMEQLNSRTGYITFIRFIQEFVTPIVNNEFIDKELEIHYPEAVGKIKFKYIVDVDNEKELAEIGTMCISNYPNLPTELILSTYYKRLWKQVEVYKDVFGDDWEDKIDNDLGKFDGEGFNDTLGNKVLGQNAHNRSLHSKANFINNEDDFDKNDENNKNDKNE